LTCNRLPGQSRVKISGIVFDDQGQVRAGWRVLFYLLLCALGSAALLAGYMPIAASLFPAATNASRLDQIAPYALICAAAILAAFIMLRLFDKLPLRTLGYSIHIRTGVEVAQGILLAFIMISFLFGIEWIAGCVSLSWTGFHAGRLLLMLAYYLAFFGLSSAMEELLARGYAFQVLVQGVGKTGAVCISAMFFSLGHFNNPHVDVIALLNTILAGIWLSIAYLKTRSLWLPTSLHMTWNLTLGFIYGYPVSGVAVPDAMIKLSQRGSAWITGGSYGPEGGVLSTGILIAATLLLLRSRRVKPAETACALWHSDSRNG
jgi:uncharacterized protein